MSMYETPWYPNIYSLLSSKFQKVLDTWWDPSRGCLYQLKRNNLLITICLWIKCYNKIVAFQLIYIYICMEHLDILIYINYGTPRYPNIYLCMEHLDILIYIYICMEHQDILIYIWYGTPGYPNIYLSMEHLDILIYIYVWCV